MPSIALVNMDLFKAAMATTSPPWKGLQGRQDEAHSAFTNSIMANQATDQALGDALSPIFKAAGGVLGGLAQGGVQNLFGPQPGAGSSATLVPGIHGGGGGGGGGSYTQGDPGSHWSGGPAGSTPLF